MRKLVFLFSLLLSVLVLKAANVKFSASAPNAVVMGEQFRLSFTVNAEAKDLRVQEMPDFEVLMGPSQSKSYSSSWVNGQSSSETTITFTYILMPKKVGTFNIAPATIKVNGANYVSNALSVKVLPPDKASSASGDKSTGSNSNQAGSQAISNDGLFIKMQVASRTVYEQEGFVVTFKLYSLYDCGLNEVKFPEFEGFLAQEIELPELWRIEFQLRGKACADTWTTCDKNLLIHTIKYPESVSGVWRNACENVRKTTEGIEWMTDYEKRKCRKLLKESKGTDLMPAVHQAIKKSESRLQAELEQWMPGGTEQ